MEKLMDNTEKAKKILAENIYCTVATATPEGKPWISPVFFVYDGAYNIYWASNKNALHSELIRKNPRVAIVIFDTHAPEGAGTAVYMEATTEELSKEEDVAAGIELFNARATGDDFKIKSPADVTGEGVWRIYKAVPTQISLLENGEYINGQYVDKRVPVDL
jgi:nitroimidazol reductase NimA-like FMN-containing flavoprotein (pyridoxamine 5'-phosphate oxidase superfamily)